MLRKHKLRSILFLLLAALGVFFAVPPTLLEQTGFSRAVFDRNGTLLRLTTSSDETYRLHVPLADISPQLKEAVLLHEDQFFYTHIGVNPVALGRAFVKTYLTSGRRMGASTLSMQLARRVYGINSHHIPGKLWQMLCALKLELYYSKDELFEAYLTLAPYGYNIEGVGAASLIYFGKTPDKLTLPEALTLAVIPQSPARRSPDAKNPDKRELIAARNRLFDKWKEAHPHAKNQSPYFALPLQTGGLRDLPFHAPHLVQHVLSQTTESIVYTTLDLPTQQLLSRLLAAYVKDRNPIGITNASALLLDTQTMEITAAIGSADFMNATIKGQVDGTRARRSPGSALKPFIYALALQQGLIHPRTLLVDAPSAYGAYNPENFDRDFTGAIIAEDALRLSRNIPALKLAAQLKKPTLYEWLKQSGIGKLAKREDYGLALVLGGVEVTMRELVGLYAMLANDGIIKPLRFLRDTPATAQVAKRLMSPEASFIALTMLKDTPRPFTRENGLEVYWKTGTSNGFRDAWTVGVFGHYVLAVWVGNFEGNPNPAFIGVRSAAPLFFQMVDAIHAREPQRNLLAAKAPRLKIREVEVCATTGDIGDKECPKRAKTWYIPGVSPLMQYDVYRAVPVDKQSGLPVCEYDSATTEYRVFEYWPSDILQMLSKAGIHKTPPPPMPECMAGTQVASGTPPRITSPSSVVEYTVRMQESEDNAINFRAVAAGDTAMLYWFLGDRYIGASPPARDFFWQGKPGQYTLRVVDDKGRTSSTRFNVMIAE